MITLLVGGAVAFAILALFETRTNLRMADGGRSHLLMWGLTGTLIFSAMLTSYMDRALSPSQRSSRAACVEGDVDDLVRAALGPLQGQRVTLCDPDGHSRRS